MFELRGLEAWWCVAFCLAAWRLQACHAFHVGVAWWLGAWRLVTMRADAGSQAFAHPQDRAHQHVCT